MLSLKLAFRSVIRNRRHSAASLLSITLGFLAMAAAQGYYADCQSQFTDSYVNRTMTGHIIIDRRSDSFEDSLMTIEEIAAIQRSLASLNADVKSVIRFLTIEGTVAGGGPSAAYAGVGYDVQEGERVRGKDWVWNALYGKPLDGKTQNQIGIGAGLAEILGCKTEGLTPVLNTNGSFKPSPADVDCFNEEVRLTAVTEKNQMNASDSLIYGIVDANIRDLEDSWIMMPLEQAQTLLNTQKLSMIGIHLYDGDKAESIRNALRKDLAQDFPFLTIDRWQDHPLAEIYRSMTSMMLILQFFVLIIVILVSTLSMVNTVTRSIDARQAEIGTLRAVGFENAFVTRLFAWEGAVLGLMASLLGIAGSFVISRLVDWSSILYYPALISHKVPLNITFLPLLYVFLSLVLTGGAALTAAIVARMRISKEITNLLTHDG